MPSSLKRTLVALGLLLITVVAYQPAWHGGMLWDDDRHITSEELQSAQGLFRIWFEVGATQQYYPVVHSAFWLMHRAWGGATLGYHLVNILLHATSACLLAAVLGRLGVRGGWFAAAMFAVHPVHVESVAWITELKNTLSGVWYLSAAFVYLSYERRRHVRTYAAAFGLFVVALLSKSVTATLPGALLVAVWWRQGALQWKRDGRPLVPFFVVGAASGLFTAWVERTWIGAQGSDFQLTILERGLLACRAAWFYLGTLAWPADLIFIYPRWTISQSDPILYAWAVCLIALLALAWVGRRRSRAPLAVLLSFLGALFPVLGFFNVYPFRFSFVADHFAYLASLPVIALAAAGLGQVPVRWPRVPTWATTAVAALLVCILAAQTWRQSAQYVDAITLYRQTLAANPGSWLAHANLGSLLREADASEGLAHLAEAVRLKPDVELTRFDYANALARTGRTNEAIEQYREAIRLAPGFLLAHANLGHAYRRAAHLQDAAREFQSAAALQPDSAQTQYDLAGTLVDLGRVGAAKAAFQEALRLDPGLAEAHNDFGALLQQEGELDDAIRHYSEAVRLRPDLAVARSALGSALLVVGRLDEAEQQCRVAVDLEPSMAVAHFDLGNVLQRRGKVGEAIEAYTAALTRDDGNLECHYNRATALDAAGRRAEAASEWRWLRDAVPDPAMMLTVTASALESQGRLGEAKAAYQGVLRAVPDAQPAQQGIRRVDHALRSRERLGLATKLGG